MSTQRRPAQGITRQQFLQMAPSLAASLGIPETQARAALAAALHTLPNHASDKPRSLQLVCTCRPNSCESATSDHFHHTAKKRCIQQLDAKLDALQLLQAARGGQLQLCLMNNQGLQAAAELPSDLHIQVSVVDAAAFQTAMQESEGSNILEECMLNKFVQSSKSEDKPLLSTRSHGIVNRRGVVFPMRRATITLPELVITDNSQPLASGQMKLQLLMWAVNQQGIYINTIDPLLSDSFVVTDTMLQCKDCGTASVPNAEAKHTSSGNEVAGSLVEVPAAAVAAALPKSTAVSISSTPRQNDNHASVDNYEGDTWSECSSSSCTEGCFRRLSHSPPDALAKYGTGASFCN